MFQTDLFPEIQKIENFGRMGLSYISGSKNTRRICRKKKTGSKSRQDIL